MDTHVPQGWRPTRAWVREMADAEDQYVSVSVGGLAADLGLMRDPAPESRRAFTRFIDLARRDRHLTVEQLAERADIDLPHLVGVMEEDAPPTPRTIYKLAHVLGVATTRLMELSGLADVRDGRLAEAAVRFAARSEPTARLTKEERAALNEFVKVLAERTDS